MAEYFGGFILMLSHYTVVSALPSTPRLLRPCHRTTSGIIPRFFCTSPPFSYYALHPKVPNVLPRAVAQSSANQSLFIWTVSTGTWPLG